VETQVGKHGAASWKDWSLRPLVLFVATYTIIAILHESAHALTAYALKVPSVLFHLYVHINRADGTLTQRAFIGVAGPLFCLLLGLVCWFAYWKSVGTRARLALLYLAWFGVATLLGNLISTPFVGDFSALAQAMQWRMSVRYGLSVVGTVLLCGWAFYVGRELRQFAPPKISAVKALIGMIVVPVVVGTAVALLIFLPMPAQFVVGRIAESSFWIFAALGILLSRKQFYNTLRSGLSWGDVALLLFAVTVVRLMIHGIALAP
jgi:hypothetical protein